MPKDDGFGRGWIIPHAREILDEYSGELITVRQLYYRLVTIGMPNGNRFYKRVVAAMKVARWDGLVPFGAFVDRERAVHGETQAESKDLESEIRHATESIKDWMEFYFLERWSNQPNYVEVWIEKKALQGVFERPCNSNRVALCPCKGYPSLTFLYEAQERYIDKADGKDVIILYFGDYDPSGEDIPRSIEATLRKLGANITLKRIALMEDQVVDWGLPPAPTKQTDSRAANWDGLGQVELDAVEPRKLRTMVGEAIQNEFDTDLWDSLLERQDREAKEYRERVKEEVIKIADNLNEE